MGLINRLQRAEVMPKLSTIFWIVTTIIVGNCAYALVPLFLPIVLEGKGVQG
jgi:hypothetical protein